MVLCFRNYCHSFTPNQHEWTSRTTTIRPTPRLTTFITTCRYTNLSMPHLTTYIVRTITHLHKIEVVLYHLTTGCLQGNNKRFSNAILCCSCEYQNDTLCIVSIKSTKRAREYMGLRDLRELIPFLFSFFSLLRTLTSFLMTFISVQFSRNIFSRSLSGTPNCNSYERKLYSRKKAIRND